MQPLEKCGTKYLTIEAKVRYLKAQLTKLETEQSRLEEDLKNELRSTTRFRHGDLEVYLDKKLWATARDGDYPRACEALKETGLGRFVHETFHVGTLSAWVRKYQTDYNFAPSLSEGILVEERETLKVRSAK